MGFLMIYSTLRDQNRSFCCQVNGNIMLSKFFYEMRLLRSLRPRRSLRLLRQLKLLRFLMAGKSPSNQLLIFWAKEAVEVIEVSDAIMSVGVIEATEVFKTT
jgi:hypothetical protein